MMLGYPIEALACKSCGYVASYLTSQALHQLQRI